MPRLRSMVCLVLLFLAPYVSVHAQVVVPVVMLSDVHFDPFRDPAKFPQLRAEPITRWPAILKSPMSPTQAADLQALQTACDGRALDTAWPALQTAFAAAHEAEPRPLFVLLSGDLLAHGFPCRFRHLAPGSTAQDQADFAAKTVSFVVTQLRGTFPRIPVYAALGNNDSGCADYRETPGDAFVHATANTLALPASATPEGDYNVPLPPPMVHARLIVLQDIFESRQFSTCAGSSDRSAEKAQMDWLRAQLAAARAHSEHVWVMAHIPPGVDVYTSFRHYLLQPAGMCNASTTAFLADSTFSDALLDFADVVRLALFGHTHMDEVRLLHRASQLLDHASASPESPSSPDTPASVSFPPKQRSAGVERPVAHTAGVQGTGLQVIPAKLVPSISPYLGNHPAFLVATVDPRSAVLKDWRTFVSPGAEGSTPPWAEAYRFTAAYHLPDFSAASALELAHTFAADKTGQSAQSTTFRQHFYPGDIGLYALGLAQIWPAYACSVREDRPSAVHKCVCAALPGATDGGK